MGTENVRLVDINEPLFSVPLKKLPENMAAFYDKNYQFKNSAFIPFSPGEDLFFHHCMSLIFVALICNAFILENASEYISDNKWFTYTLAFCLYSAYLFWRVRVHIKAYENARVGKIKNGIFLINDYMVIGKKSVCHVFPKASIVRINRSWTYGNRSDHKAIGVNYKDSKGVSGLYSFDDDFLGKCQRDDIIEYLNIWLTNGLRRKGILRFDEK